MKMYSRYSICLILLNFIAINSTFAQLPVADIFQKAYTKGTRDQTGAPGKNYWQNGGNYKLNIQFDPISRLLKGDVEIDYINNSPDTLKEIWFKLYPNLYKKGVERKSEIEESDLGAGVNISKFVADGREIELNRLVIEGTNMHTNALTLNPGKHLKLKISYSYSSNKGSHLRTGQVDGGSHFIAYFFPRVAVYDDVDGWNKIPYSGSEEFYNDFCDFTASIRVPKGYGVWATGDLTNANEVYTKAVANKLSLAERSDEVITVIDSSDLTKGFTNAMNDFNTFQFKAKNVVDFVFATSNHFLWKSQSLVVDSTTKRRTRVDAVFNPKHKDYYEVIDFAQKTVSAMSFKFPKWPYPYSHETVFDGLDQMEYPMMVNDNPVNSRQDAITLTDHEIFHTMFPFYMGINETKYAWMDEGWATIGEWIISPMIDSTFVDEYGIAPTANTSGSKNDTPIMTLTTELKGSGTFTNAYPKPALGYLFLKDYLGDEKFTKALHHYIRNWNGKHPMPYDFFYSMNTGAAENLDWFWKRWFFEGGVTDMAITAVAKIANGYQITIENKSQKPLPIDLTVTYSDQSTAKYHQSISAWKDGKSTYVFPIATPKKVTKVVLGSSHVPDKNKRDNTFVVN